MPASREACHEGSDLLPKTNRAYKSAKRNKELDRQRKQEEKRRRRLGAGDKPAEDGDMPAAPSETPVEGEPEAAADKDPEAPGSDDPA